MSYELVKLDQRARQYMIQKTSGGLSLSQAFLGCLDSDSGLVYSIWPENATRDKIYSFKDGVGGGFLHHGDIESQFIGYIRSFLSIGTDKVVIFENSLASSGDPWLPKARSHLLFHNGEVYHFLMSRHNEADTVLMHVREAMKSWRNWVLFSSLPVGTDLVNRGELDGGVINTLAARTERCAIDAYDFDGYLIWEF